MVVVGGLVQFGEDGVLGDAGSLNPTRPCPGGGSPGLGDQVGLDVFVWFELK